MTAFELVYNQRAYQTLYILEVLGLSWESIVFGLINIMVAAMIKTFQL